MDPGRGSLLASQIKQRGQELGDLRLGMPTGGSVFCPGNVAPLLSSMQRLESLQSPHHIPAPASLGTGRESHQGKHAPICCNCLLVYITTGNLCRLQLWLLVWVSQSMPLRHYFHSLSSGWGTDVWGGMHRHTHTHTHTHTHKWGPNQSWTPGVVQLNKRSRNHSMQLHKLWVKSLWSAW